LRTEEESGLGFILVQCQQLIRRKGDNLKLIKKSMALRLAKVH